MHILISFAVLAGLVMFAFGGDVARVFVRACLVGVAMCFLAFVTYVAIDIVRTPPIESAKVPEFTPELRTQCAEWRSHPNDAPRMCFAVLEQCNSPTDGICGHMPRVQR